MSKSKKRPDDPVPSLWSGLGPVDQAREWEDFRPGAFEEVFKLAIKQAKHEFLMDYIAVGIQLLALIFGFTAVVIVALIAKYYVDHHAAEAGARIFGFGTASIVAAFLGVNSASILRRVNSRWSRVKSD